MSRRWPAEHPRHTVTTVRRELVGASGIPHALAIACRMAAGLVAFGLAVVALTVALDASALADAPSAAVTVYLTSPGFSGNGSTYVVEIKTKGAPPSAGTGAVLVDSAGRNTSRVTVDPTACARPHDVRYTSLGTSSWCLRIKRPAPGSSVSGTLAGPDSTLALTLGTRRHLMGWPIIDAFGGLIVASLLILASPSYFRSLVRYLRLRAALADNRVVGFDMAWINGHRGDRKRSDPGLVQTLVPIAEHGTDRVSKARLDLGKAAESAGKLHPDWAVLNLARSEAARSDYQIDDFLDDQVAPVVDKATSLTALLADVALRQHVLDQDRGLVDSFLGDRRTELDRDADLIHRQIGAATTSYDLERVDRLLGYFEARTLTPDLPAPSSTDAAPPSTSSQAPLFARLGRVSAAMIARLPVGTFASVDVDIDR